MRVEIAALRPPRLWLLAAMVTFYLVFVPCAFISNPRTTAYPPVLLGFGVMWVVGAIYVYYLTCWSLAGVEILSTDRDWLYVERRLFGRTLSRNQYLLKHIDYVLLDQVDWFLLGLAHPLSFRKGCGFGVGPVLFVCEGRRVRVAEGLRGEEDVASELVALLRRLVSESKRRNETSCLTREST